MNIAYYHSPIGTIVLTANEKGLLTCTFTDERIHTTSLTLSPLLSKTLSQLDAYFQGQCQHFSLPLHPQGTSFHQKVWTYLLSIPFGTTASYSEVAQAIDHPKAARAVGQANHCNPIAIIIPCHRVIGKQGNLVGYGEGLWRKQWLLRHESTYLNYSS